MVNFIIAIIVSAALGFLAGHFFTAGDDLSPISSKEAVTGEAESEPAKFQAPRPVKEKAKANLPPVMCQEGTSLQEQMARMKFVELQNLCSEAERDWQARNVDSYAPGAKDLNEQHQFGTGVLQVVKEPLLTSAYWHGRGTIVDGDRTIQAEILVNWYHSKDSEEAQNQRTTLTVQDPLDLCLGIAPYFTINGKLYQQAGSSMSQCGASFRKRGDTYYILWNTFNDRELSPTMSVLLIPIPGSRQAALEFLHSGKGQWASESNFHWRPSTFQETHDLRERYLKKLEHSSR